MVLTVAAHLLPGWVRGKSIGIHLAAWPVWVFCFAGVMYNSLNYFTSAAERASVIRETASQDSFHNKQIEERIRDATIERDAIVARPVTTVAKKIANEVRLNRLQALNIEYAEAKRKASLTDQISELKRSVSNDNATHATNATILAFANATQATHAANSSVALVAPMIFSITLEFLGMLLWRDVWNKTIQVKAEADMEANTGNMRLIDDDCLSDWNRYEIPPGITGPFIDHIAIKFPFLSASRGVHIIAAAENKQFNTLVAALRDGKCSATYRSIREYLKCSSGTATEYNRRLRATRLSMQCN